MIVKKRNAYELEIIDLAIGGNGLAKPEGFPIFVDRCVPGDKVFAKIIKKKKSWATAKLIKILEPSSLRNKGKCQYCNFCGGCKWQQIDYDLQLKYKKMHVQQAIHHIGRLKDICVKDVIASDEIFEYRNKMEFSCSTKRWLLPFELENQEIKKDFGIGLHVAGTFDKVIDIKECKIMHWQGNKILEDVRNFIKNSSLPVYDLRTHQGFWRFLMLRYSKAFDKWMVNIITKEKENNQVKILAQQLKQNHDNIQSIVHNITDSCSGVSAGKDEVVLFGKDYIIEGLGKFIFEISSGSFFQTNTRACERLYSKVSEYAQLDGSQTVIDLYSGIGTIPIWLSQKTKKIYGIEIVEQAIVNAKKNAKLNLINNCEFILGDVKNVLAKLNQKANIIIADPPRAGMHKDVIQQILSKNPEKIIYISCNPSSLARDLEIMSFQYDIKKIQPLDMFPHTPHIESISLLSNKK